MWVSAKAMFSVPSVTMKGGRRILVTSPPLRAPKAAHTASPSRIARNGLRPETTASLAITTAPRAMTAPSERSMPAVRMTSVWPMARVPTTMTCWTISDRLVPVRNRGDSKVKKAAAMNSAIRGPSVESWPSAAERRARARSPPLGPSWSGVAAALLMSYLRCGEPSINPSSSPDRMPCPWSRPRTGACR